MTPKETAENLFERYYNRIEHTLSEDVSGFEKDIVKHLVLIAIDAIMDELTVTNYGLQYLNRMAYWNEVKEEIEKL